MGKSLNRVELIGRLVADPDMRWVRPNVPVSWFQIETVDHLRNTEEDVQIAWEWHYIVAWGTLAQQCYDFLTQHTSVFIDGRLSTRLWTDEQGQEQHITEIIANDLIILSSPASYAQKTDDLDLLKDYPVYGTEKIVKYAPPEEPDFITQHKLMHEGR